MECTELEPRTDVKRTELTWSRVVTCAVLLCPEAECWAEVVWSREVGCPGL